MKKEETAVVTVNYLLETESGFDNDECINAIQSPALKKAVLGYRKAAVSREKANWNVAIACAAMKPDLTKEFGSDATLALFLGLANKGAFNKLRRVGAYAKECQEHFISVTTAIELLPLERCNVTNCNGETRNFVSALIEDGEIDGLTKMEVREYVKQHLNALSETSESDDSDSDSSDETAYADTDSIKNENEEDPAEISWLPVIQIDYRVYEQLSTAKLNKLRKLTDSFCLAAIETLGIEGNVDDTFYTI